MDILGLALIILLVLFGIGSIENRISRQDRRMARVEHKLDLVLGHLGLSEPEPWSDEINALLVEGKKIQAIKVYREATGAGLKEAKEAVDKLG
ncbi:ribosomal protein L7/L12 [Streptomyces spinosirectus]|jgi:ribosomal protein L7/L12|uniref:ribosomal protein L7/L12 n=1 Tax=Streptomyces TaxID=1883 RepID=UPI000FFE381E|nr:MULTISPECIES: ribosomal protein L7/L12 [Streptomyces]MBY8342993.1 ribosomal protein L7/L12 [Streptomyces plumbidurans]UIR19208.1 ribosomal protein L7/L12 [Streptomyces spinosirectus]